MKIIFLDIDGVLQPIDDQNRFKHNLDQLQADKAKEDALFNDISKWDIGAVCYDWSPKAVQNLKLLVNKTGAKIVVSSDWRVTKNKDKMKLLFGIHGFGDLLYDYTPILEKSRSLEVKQYLDEHPDIEMFVIIDDVDWKFTETFPDNFVQPYHYFDEESYNKALDILS